MPVVVDGGGCAARSAAAATYRRAPQASAGQLVSHRIVRALARINGTSGIAISGHYIVDLFELVSQSLFRREFVLFKGYCQLFVVLACIGVELVQGAIRVKFVRVQL